MFYCWTELTSLTAARIMAEKGRKVLIVEQHEQIVGNCYDYKNQEEITVYKYGPQLFPDKE